MTFTWKEAFWIAIIAFVGVWLIDKGLTYVGGSKYAVNSPSS
jgi:hypothetical protein